MSDSKYRYKHKDKREMMAFVFGHVDAAVSRYKDNKNVRLAFANKALNNHSVVFVRAKSRVLSCSLADVAPLKGPFDGASAPRQRRCRQFGERMCGASLTRRLIDRNGR